METLRARLGFIRWFTIALFLLLTIRFAQLELVMGRYYASRALNNTSRAVMIHPLRGRIINADGEIIAGRREEFQLDLFITRHRNLKRYFSALQALLPERREDIQQRESVSAYFRPFVPFTVLHNLDPGEIAILASRRFEHPDLMIQRTFSRYYSFESLFAHVVGYVGDPSAADLQKESTLLPGESVGRRGMEKEYDSLMRGRPGEWLVVVDAHERETNRYLKRPEHDGSDLHLTLSTLLQEKAMELMEGRRGAVVMIKTDGAVLAYLSSPSYDPNIFLSGVSRTDWNALLHNPDRPLLDRCSQGLYPPGSLIKPFIAVMALSSGTLDPARTVTCSGGYTFGNHTYHCWLPGGHGTVGLHDALVRSCDTYFYRLARDTGINTLASWLRRSGFGNPTDIDLPHESRGLVPNEQWSLDVRKTPWYPGETISVGIGQGPILTTPLQMAVLYASLANGGRIPRPHFNRNAPSISKPLPATPKAIAFVQKALRDVVADPHGTAHWVSGRVEMAGKTGTAQIMRKVEGKPYRLEHAWFCGWAPVKNPKYVACVLVEESGHGSSKAAPVAADLLALAIEEKL